VGWTTIKYIIILCDNNNDVMTKALLLGVAVAVPVGDCGVCWIVDCGFWGFEFGF
jgi:hypothetical protein